MLWHCQRHPSPPTPTPHTHGDDLGIELGRQAGHAGLGAEEAVEGLHGTRCHQLQRTRHQEGGSSTASGTSSHPCLHNLKAGSAWGSSLLL